MLASVEMLRMGAEAWVTIDIPDLTPRQYPVFSQIDSQSIAILGGVGSKFYPSDGVLLNAETAAVVRMIDPVSEIKFDCLSQSFMRSAGEIVSLVFTSKLEVHLISYNQAENTIKTIQNYGEY